MIGAELERMLRQLVREEVSAAIGGAGPAPTRLITVQEYAATRSVSVSTVRTAIRAGRLKATRIGRAVRVSADAEIARATKATTANARAAASLGLGGHR